jgi:hypothetical protein
VSNAASGPFSTVGGGEANEVTAEYGTIAGGGGGTDANVVTDASGTIAGGGGNQAGDAAGTPFDAEFAAVGGGRDNTASGRWSVVAGGQENIAGGQHATIAGGYQNIATGDFSFAAGSQAKANHEGTFVWADSQGVDLYTDRDRQFKVRAQGGSKIENGQGFWVEMCWNASRLIETSTGAYLSSGGVWTDVSDRNAKENLSPVRAQDVLELVSELPISIWNFKVEDASVRHMGPMAQDFYRAFRLGPDDRHMSALDSAGVALAATQGLYEVVKEKDATIAEQKRQIADLNARLQHVEMLLTSLAGGSEGGVR